MSQAELSAKSRIATSKISDYVRGNFMPSAELVVELSDALGVRPQWLVLGRGEKKESGQEISDILSVPVLNIRLAAGAGAWNSETMVRGQMLFDKELLGRLGRTNVEGLFVANCDGDSMEPLMSDGAPVLIDGSDTRIREGIFAFRLGETLRIKRLRPVGWKGIEMISENPIYPPERIEHDDFEHFEIIGKAIWAGTTL
ncbi:putative HTH-type transcriptional regulator [Asticcacaulis sp. MM231]